MIVLDQPPIMNEERIATTVMRGDAYSWLELLMAVLLPIMSTLLISPEQQLPIGEKSACILLFIYGYTNPTDGAQRLA